MKNIFFTVIIAFFTLACKSQIVSLDANYWEVPAGAYFKDLDNEMDKFVGTWQYNNNGTDFLNIVLQKKTHVYNGEFYEDYLVGEYRYVQNNVEIINTIPNNPLEWNNIDERSIGGRYFISNDEVVICNDCTSNERRIDLYFSDSERNYLSLSLVLRYLPQLPGEPEKMTATLISTHGGMIPNENSPTVPRVPLGEYLMTKQ